MASDIPRQVARKSCFQETTQRNELTEASPAKRKVKFHGLGNNKRQKGDLADVYENEDEESIPHRHRHSNRHQTSSNGDLSIKDLQQHILELNEQQDADRTHFQQELDDYADQLMILREALEDQPHGAPLRLTRDNSNIAEDPKSKDDDSDASVIELYDAPQPRKNHGQGREVEFEAGPNFCTVTEKIVTLFDGMPMPSVVEDLPPAEITDLPDNLNEAFTFQFLKRKLGGARVSHGFYEVVSAAKSNGKAVRPFPQIKSYMLVSREHEPLLPRMPGAHGALISSFMQYRNDDNGEFPLFVKDCVSGGYRYYGTYKEPSISDIVGSNEMAAVPHHTKYYWAKELGTLHKNGKAQKHITALREMWPMVKVGWLNKETKTIIDYKSELEDEFGELEVLKRLITEEEAEALTAEDIMAAFETSDLDSRAPSAHLHFEYLQCIGYDIEFYEALVSAKRRDST